MPNKVDVLVARERVGRLCYSLADKPLPDDNHTPLSLNELLNSDIEESCATSSPLLEQLINTHTGFTPIGEAIGHLLQQRIL